MSPAHQFARNPAPASEDEHEIARLQGENLALQSLLHGLCVALSQMSELHREVVIQACEHARRAEAQAVNRPDASQPRAEAFNNVVTQLRSAIMDRYRSF
jgi:hypothetical protein